MTQPPTASPDPSSDASHHDDATEESPRPFEATPQPPSSMLLGHVPAFKRDMLKTLMESRARYGDRVRFRLLNREGFFVAHPDDLNHVLIRNNRNFVKTTRGYRAMRQLLGNGLVTSEGDFWLRQRRIAQPSFHQKRINGFAETMVNVAEKSVREWEARQAAARGGQAPVVGLSAEMTRITLDIVGFTLLSTELSSHSAKVSARLQFVLEEVTRRIRVPWSFPLSVPTPANMRVNRAIAGLDEVVEGIIARRRKGQDNPEDLLTMLMEARDEESGEGMSDAQLRDEVMTIFLAGYETTATALTWTFYMLSQHPEAEARLHAELDEVLEGGRLPTLADLPRLAWTRMVIEESMRLYPPVPMLARTSVEDDVIGGYQVPAGTFVILSPYVTHRHPDFWESPETFDPERFRDPKAERPRFAYFPFLGGPRQCIGKSFAMMEAQLVLATLASRFKLRCASDAPVKPNVTVTLGVKKDIPMRLVAR
ncbi:cytochrome P450 [Lujinxingia sediminis]|uniref:Cytochrome P450 n=1 Tax=Lujinxingia sediminis TaxID=2480984 RepID=A0ABY0CUA7_9DELT|nr:cytochrome P450 [Lujinxingia sediminis]RVU45852.1 cytochrome P450 [Lujinxingia sediminis]